MVGPANRISFPTPPPPEKVIPISKQAEVPTEAESASEAVEAPS